MSRPSLAETQARLRRVLTDPRGPTAAIRKGDRELLRDAPPWPIDDRLNVYANAYFARLLEAIGAVYPRVREALGEERFRRAVAAHLTARKPSSPIIEDASRGFDRVLKGKTAALARLEWATLEAIYTDRAAESFPPIADWSKAKLLLDPTVRLVDGWLVWRDAEGMRSEKLSAVGARTLEALRRGMPLGRATRGLSAKTAGALFSRWRAQGVVVGAISPRGDKPRAGLSRDKL